jgi:hypothetical protein
MNGTQHFTVLFLREDNGTVSGYLPALPGVFGAYRHFLGLTFHVCWGPPMHCQT